jgi:Fe-S cluster biogenesis protein NfuA
VQGLILAHGGEIALESVEHRGTTMTVTLPACRTVATRQKTSQSAIGQHSREHSQPGRQASALVI